jgi:glycine C-acetyltransferase
MMERADIYYDFLEYMKSNGRHHYRLQNNTGCSSVMNVGTHNVTREFVSFVTSDYLGFTQHPKVKQAAIEGVEKYGTGTAATPLIGDIILTTTIWRLKLLPFWTFSGRSRNFYNRIHNKQCDFTNPVAERRYCDCRYGSSCKCI